MLSKNQKIKFVEDAGKELSSYGTVGIINLGNIPDKLLQSTKNSLRGETKFIIGRKNMLARILNSNEGTRTLAAQLSGTSAIILSNDDPFELYSKFRTKAMKLAAKPGQIAVDDVEIKSGETGMQPGQAVTDLKSAGIDVQIQKGKVVIVKDVVLVKKGDTISLKVAKVLHMLGIEPFNAVIEPIVMINKGITFSKEALSTTKESTIARISEAFAKALALSFNAGIINTYTISPMVSKAYMSAIALGIGANIYAKGITDSLIAKALSQAKALEGASGSNA